METLVVICFVAIVFGIAAFATRYKIYNLNLLMKELAGEMGLDAEIRKPGIIVLEADYPVLKGTINGKSVWMKAWYKGSGRNQYNYTEVRMECYNPRGITFSITAEGLLLGLGKMMGAQDIETGDREFDDKFRVQCANPDVIRFLLNPDIRKALTDVWSYSVPNGGLKLEGNQLVFFECQHPKTDRKYLKVMKALRQVSSRMDELGWGSQGVETFWEMEQESSQWDDEAMKS